MQQQTISATDLYTIGGVHLNLYAPPTKERNTQQRKKQYEND